MINPSSKTVAVQEVIGYLRRDLRLREIYQEIAIQKIIINAAREENQTISDEEIQQEIDTICRNNGIYQPAQLMRWVAEHQATLSDIRLRITEKLLAQKLANHLFRQQAEARLQANRRDFETIFLYKILVPYESLAREIFYQIEEEEISFFEAAHVYDLDESRRQRCGFEGKYQRWQLSSELAALLQDVDAGSVVGPQQTNQNQFMLLLIDELLLPEPMDDLVKTYINHLFQQWLNEHLSR
jgi:hypothetical protein